MGPQEIELEELSSCLALERPLFRVSGLGFRDFRPLQQAAVTAEKLWGPGYGV